MNKPSPATKSPGRAAPTAKPVKPVKPALTPEPVPEELVATDTPETAHIDELLVEIARASVAEVRLVPEAATQLELALTDLEPAPGPPQHIPLWARVVADPGFAAEHAAREAVDRLGPEARDWVARTWARYPAASRAALVRLAADDAVRMARRQGAASGAAGVLGSVVATGMLARAQARLVLTIAAAYGLDPLARERARDLLVVLRVPRLTQPTPAALRNAARVLANVATHRIAARVMPFGAALAGATIGARGTRDVADRAMAHYGGSKHA